MWDFSTKVTVYSRWGWFGEWRRILWWDLFFMGVVFLPGLCYPCPDLLWFYFSWVGRLSWDFYRRFSPFQTIAALEDKHIPHSCLGSLWFFLWTGMNCVFCPREIPFTVHGWDGGSKFSYFLQGQCGKPSYKRGSCPREIFRVVPLI